MASKAARHLRDYYEAYHVKLETLCGVTVALAQVPEAVSFAFVAGLSPAVGINSAWIIGVVTAVCGGRPAMICGATGALAVVLPELVRAHGKEHVFCAVMFMGVIQIFLGVCQVGRVVKMIPIPVMTGFCNGLALVIGMAQFNTYKKGLSHHRCLGGAFGAFTDGKAFIDGEELAYSITITIIAFLICVLMPRLTKKVPSALTAIVVCTILEWAVIRALIGAQTATVHDASGGGVGGDFPYPVWFVKDYNMPDFSFQTFKEIWNVSLVLAAIGLLESLMTLNLIDDMTSTTGSPTRECLAQGFANLLCGVLGGMGGCAMIGQSMINIGSGARNRVSSTSAGLFLLLIVLVASPAIDCIPVSALAGVMFNVVYHTFEWSTFRLICGCLPYRVRSKAGHDDLKIRRADTFVILLVTVVTLFTDLAVAVVSGTVFSCLLFAWESSESIFVNAGGEVFGENGEVLSKVYDVDGILFFGSTKKFLSQFDEKSDPKKIYVTFKSGMISDYSALECLNQLAERYSKEGKTVTLQRLKPTCLKALRKAGSLVSFETELLSEAEEELPKVEHHHYNIESYEQGHLDELVSGFGQSDEHPSVTNMEPHDEEKGAGLTQRATATKAIDEAVKPKSSVQI